MSHITIGRALKKKYSLTTFDVGHLANSKSIRKVQCPKVEQDTFSWFTTMQEKGATISNDLLVATTHRFNVLQPRDPSEKELQFSHGWVTKFKKRFNIKAYTHHGEDAYVDTSSEVLKRMEEIKTIVSEYDSNDVFNMDETGLFYTLEPR